jgi:hypothetical protein
MVAHHHLSAALLNHHLGAMAPAQMAAFIPQHNNQQAAAQQFPPIHRITTHRVRNFRPTIIANTTIPVIDQKKRPLNSYMAFRSRFPLCAQMNILPLTC